MQRVVAAVLSLRLAIEDKDFDFNTCLIQLLSDFNICLIHLPRNLGRVNMQMYMRRISQTVT